MKDHPATWDTALEVTPEQRADIPYGIGSYLRTAIAPEYYSKCTVGEGGPGWESVPQAGCPIRWETARCERSAPLTIDQAAAALGWEILRNSDLQDITHTLSLVWQTLDYTPPTAHDAPCYRCTPHRLAC